MGLHITSDMSYAVNIYGNTAMATNTTAYTAGTRLKVIEGCKIPTPLTDFVIKEDLRGLYLGDDKLVGLVNAATR